MWYNPNTWGWVQKLNPAQERIAQSEGDSIYTQDNPVPFRDAFDKLEVVGRGTNIIVSACASLDFDIKASLPSSTVSGMRQKSLDQLVNFRPNPYQSVDDFRKNMFTDFIIEGNVFLYFDGAFLYHLPAAAVSIETDTKTFVSGYKYLDTTFKPNEIIHFKDINPHSIYRGASRLSAAQRSVSILYKMQQFQEQFFDNGAIPGLVFTTDNTLSSVAKDKTIQLWTQRYNPKNGARKPLILDSGLKPNPLMNTNFHEMDFDTSIDRHEKKILKALGVPPILLDSGNNANISPNLRLFYLETILPIVRAFVKAIERYFGFDVEAVTNSVSALQPELGDIASYLSTLVNGGVLTPNEARQDLRYEPKPGHDDLRIPANIAGSAGDPSQGGAPKKPKN